MSNLAAFAVSINGKPVVIEPLENHLANVAKHAGLLARRSPFANLCIATALLHDVGKSLTFYQKCLAIRRDNTCSYVAHEFFSALICWRCTELKNLERGIDEKITRSIITLATLWHHQAMGDPRDRIAKFVTYLKKPQVSTSLEETLQFDKRIIAIVSRISKELGLAITINKECIEDLEREVQRRTELKELGSLYEQTAAQAINTLTSTNDRNMFTAKYAAGITILSDIFTAQKARTNTPQSLRVKYLMKMFGFLSKHKVET